MKPHGSQTIKLWVRLQCGSEQMPDAKTLGQFLVDGMIVVEEKDRREDRSQTGVRASKISGVHAFVPCLLNNALQEAPKGRTHSRTLKLSIRFE